MAIIDRTYNNWGTAAGAAPAATGTNTMQPAAGSTLGMSSTPAQPASPYGGFRSKIGDITSGMWNMVKGGWNPNAKPGQGGGWTGGFGTWSAAPNDPLVAGYMGNLEAGSRNLMDKYVDQSVGAGPVRGGMGAAGAPNAASSAVQKVLESLGGDYRDNYKTAMGWANQAYGANAGQYNSIVSALNNILGTELQGAQSQAGFDTHFWDAGNQAQQEATRYKRGVADREAGWGREDVVDTRNWDRGATDRAFQEKQRNQQERGWYDAQAAQIAKQQQMERDKYTVARQNAGGHGIGWLNSAEAGDAAMRLAGAEGRDWWRDPARGGGGGASKGGGGSDAASWAGFTSGLLRGAR